MTIRVLNVASRHALTPTLRAGRLSFGVRLLKTKPRAIVRLSSETQSTFAQISDPANARLFTAEAALAALDDLDV
jgi:hypothetical protein